MRFTYTFQDKFITNSQITFFFWHTMDLSLRSSCIMTLCINPFATLMYDCLLVLRAVVQSDVTPQIEKVKFYTLLDVILLCCWVRGFSLTVLYPGYKWVPLMTAGR